MMELPKSACGSGMICSGYGFESTLLITSDPVPNQMFVGKSISISGLDWIRINQVIASGSGSGWAKITHKNRKKL
jgi:hypothetical protein